MIFYLCRHGETVYNAKGLLQGWFDTPLTDLGVESAHRLANKLQNIEISAVISSDLGRAFMTAYIISRDIGYTAEILRSQALREVSFGDLSGLPEDEIERFYHRLGNALTYTPPNGETLENMQHRVMAYIRNLASKTLSGPILFVTHDCVMNAVYSSYAVIDFGKYNIDHTNPHDLIMQYAMDENGMFTSFEKL